MISLDKYSGSCNDLSPKISKQKKINDINVTVFNMITNKNDAKQWQNIFHTIANVNSIVQLATQIKNGITTHVNVSVKIIIHAKKYYSWNVSACICENGRYLKCVVDDSKILRDEII